MDHSPLLGTWINANPETRGVARVVVAEAGKKLIVQVFAIGPSGRIDWGVSDDVTLYALEPAGRAAGGFTCKYDFDFVESVLQGNISKGLLVLAQFHHFKDDSGRADFFTREYFALTHDRF